MIESKGIHISRPQTIALSIRQMQQINVFPLFLCQTQQKIQTLLTKMQTVKEKVKIYKS